MGVAISSWPLARAVSLKGQLGVVSGTGIDAVLTRRLQLGDIGGHMREAFDAFPLRDVANRVWDRYFIPGGKRPEAPFKSKPLPSLKPSRSFAEMVMIANFVEVYLAKRGHNGLVGINLMEKIQLPTLPSLFGALLAGVDFVLMGAGIPRFVPGALDQLAALEAAELPISVVGAAPGATYCSCFDPAEYVPAGFAKLNRPNFIGIISSTALATTLARKCTGRVDGFVIEGPTAGGHNAPPRGEMTLDAHGEPIYGLRDIPELATIRALGLPFWFAGSFGDPGRLNEALELGAQGVQVGTPFAFCNESGMAPEIKARILSRVRAGLPAVFTDPRASPTGFPFKVLPACGSLADPAIYKARGRICDLGYLRHPYQKADGKVGYRCPAEPEKDFVSKGGDLAEAEGRKCLCNGLLATAGYGQTRKDGTVEPPIVTAGDDIVNLSKFLRPGENSYSASDVIALLLGAS
jgi:nitronate monooxygenase